MHTLKGVARSKQPSASLAVSEYADETVAFACHACTATALAEHAMFFRAVAFNAAGILTSTTYPCALGAVAFYTPKVLA